MNVFGNSLKFTTVRFLSFLDSPPSTVFDERNLVGWLRSRNYSSITIDSRCTSEHGQTRISSSRHRQGAY
jgi:hypothetical protein